MCCIRDCRTPASATSPSVAVHRKAATAADRNWQNKFNLTERETKYGIRCAFFMYFVAHSLSSFALRM